MIGLGRFGTDQVRGAGLGPGCDTVIGLGRFGTDQGPACGTGIGYGLTGSF